MGNDTVRRDDPRIVKRVLALFDAKRSERAIAEALEVSRSPVRRILKQHKRRRKPGRPRGSR